jgi:hypothetical protein
MHELFFRAEKELPPPVLLNAVMSRPLRFEHQPAAKQASARTTSGQHELSASYVLGSVVAPAAGGFATLALFGILLYCCGCVAWPQFSDASDSTPKAIASRAIGSFQLLNVIHCMSFTIVITDSLDLIRTLDGSAWVSGLMVGIYLAGSCISNVVLWAWVRADPDMWRTRTRLILIMGAGMFTLGTLLYAAVASTVDTVELQAESLGIWLFAMLSARAMQGAGATFFTYQYRRVIVHVSEPGELPTNMSTFFFFSMLGIGLGPLLSAAAHASCFCNVGSLGGHAFVAVAAIQLLIFAPTVILVAWFFPSLQHVHDNYDQGSSDSGPQVVTASTKVLMLSALTFAMLRAFTVSGLEVATAMLLEVEYHWGMVASGIAIGLTFLGCIPARMALLANKHRMSLRSQTRVFLLVALLSTLLLFDLPCAIGKEIWRWWCTALLLVGDTLIYPSLMFSSSPIEGVALERTPKVGFWNDNNFVMATAIVVECFGRGAGPPVARFLIDIGGRDAYAAQQLVVVLIAWLIAEIGVFRNLESQQRSYKAGPLPK